MGISDMSPRRESRGTRARDVPLSSRASSPLTARSSTRMTREHARARSFTERVPRAVHRNDA